MLMLIDTRPQRPERPHRGEPWRKVAGAVACAALGIGSGAASGVVAYGMLLGAVVAAGIGFGGGLDSVPWSGMREHRQ